MHGKIRNIYIILILTISVIACDTFEDDIALEGDSAFTLQTSFSITPNTDFVLDLKQSLNSSETVRFALSSPPSRGTASIDEEALLHYKPNAEFVSGTDVLNIDMFNVSGILVDTDSIVIVMTDSVDIPCFNGALADYYYLTKGDVIMFDPTLNDGICSDSVISVDLEIDPFANGVITVTDSSDYIYRPEGDFVGVDQAAYTLTLVDLNGEEFISRAFITFDVQDSNLHVSCDSLVVPYYYEIDSSAEFIDVSPYSALPACDVQDYELSITSVTNGTAEITASKQIRYYPGSFEEGRVNYNITLMGGTFQNYIDFKVVDQVDTAGCLSARYDEYFFDLTLDSIATEPFSMSPFENDSYCTPEFQINILQEPDFGTVAVLDDKYIIMTVREEFAGLRSTEILYELCDLGNCDSASIRVVVEK